MIINFLIIIQGYYGENNTVNVHVSNLRKKIKEADPENEYIRTVYGIGFKLVLHSNKTKFEAVIYHLITELIQKL